MRGRAIRLSVARRMVIDLLYFAAAVPSIPVQRPMSLGPLAAARAACRDRPQWTAIFAKGYALVAREFPDLRRAYLKIPWPHHRRTAKKRDELAPFHSITSSALVSSVGGTVRPSALAVLTLMANSNLVGTCTGSSAGFAPWRMRST